HNRYPDNLRYLRVHFCEKFILIRHGATLFGVFLSLPARFTKINLHKIQNVILISKNKYTYCIANNEYVLYIHLIQTTPATPG
ncbi:TPA: hypothetical protein ACHVU9_002825, partial [Klebsiella pneumoniae]